MLIFLVCGDYEKDARIALRPLVTIGIDIYAVPTATTAANNMPINLIMGAVSKVKVESKSVAVSPAANADDEITNADVTSITLPKCSRTVRGLCSTS